MAAVAVAPGAMVKALAAEPPVVMPILLHSAIGQRSLDSLARTLMALSKYGFLTPDDETEDRLRRMLDFPEREFSYEDRDLWSLVRA